MADHPTRQKRSSSFNIEDIFGGLTGKAVKGIKTHKKKTQEAGGFKTKKKKNSR